ncbi:MAG: zinc ribbon domain-containing protein [Motiliproteus sp.]
MAVKHWDCCECGSSHDRDTNAALNILAAGRKSFVAAGHSRP